MAEKTPTPDPTVIEPVIEPDPPTPDPVIAPKVEPEPKAEPTPKTFTQAQQDAAIAKAQKQWEKDKDLPELEKLKAANLELTTAKQTRDVTDEFTTAAGTAGAKNIDRLLKIYRSELELSGDNKIENLTAILESAKTDFPEFFSKGSADGGTGKGETKLTAAQIVDAEFAKTGRTNAFKL